MKNLKKKSEQWYNDEDNLYVVLIVVATSLFLAFCYSLLKLALYD